MLDMTKALQALSEVKVRSKGVSSEFTQNLVELFKSAAQEGIEELTCAQVVAMYNAATGDNKSLKNICDRCWVLSNKNKKNANPVLAAGSVVGKYRLA